MHSGTRRQLDEELAKQSTQDFLEMTVTEFAVWTRGAAQPGSEMNDFYRKLMQAKVSDAVCTAVYKLEESTTRATNELNRTTRRLVFATWGLAIFTAVLVLATLLPYLVATPVVGSK